jgi:hypothetical protein
MSRRSRSRRRKGLLSEWAGDSPWRRLVAWLVQTAVLIGMVAVMYLVIVNVLLPGMIDGFRETIRNTTR